MVRAAGKKEQVVKRRGLLESQFMIERDNIPLFMAILASPKEKKKAITTIGKGYGW